MEPIDLQELRDQLDHLVNPDWDERYEVRRESADGGITGYIVRKDWRGVPFAQRQRDLNDFLRERFGDRAEDVSLILTFTPEEYAAWAEDQAAAS